MTDKPNRSSHTPHSHFTKVCFAGADILKVRWRNKSSNLRKLTPRERRSALAFFVVVAQISVIILIFNYWFHTNKYTSLILKSQYFIVHFLQFLSKFHIFIYCKNKIYIYIVHAVLYKKKDRRSGPNQRITMSVESFDT